MKSDLPLSVSLIIVSLLSRSACVAAARVGSEDLPPHLKYLLEGDLDTWEAPKEISAKYPYYLSGYDYDNRPVWVIEWGRYDFRSALEKGGNYTESFHKYVDQFLYRVIESIGERPTAEDAEKEVILIADLDGFSLQQATPETIAYHIGHTRKILQLLSYVHTAFVLNVNYLGETILNLVKPLYGPDFNRLEIYGTNPAKWRPALLKKIPKDQLPEYYGGTSDFLPVRVYG